MIGALVEISFFARWITMSSYFLNFFLHLKRLGRMIFLKMEPSLVIHIAQVPKFMISLKKGLPQQTPGF